MRTADLRNTCVARDRAVRPFLPTSANCDIRDRGKARFTSPLGRSRRFDVPLDRKLQRAPNRRSCFRYVEATTRVIPSCQILHGSGWRRGDVKPDNMLRFKVSGSVIGNLRISDMGLTRRHKIETNKRSQGTSTRLATLRYEVPEAVSMTGRARSRRYDGAWAASSSL